MSSDYKKESEFCWLLLESTTNLPKCCWFCKSIVNLECHHILPRKRMGLSDCGNLSFLCKRCHTNLHERCKRDYVRYFKLNIHPELKELFIEEQKRLNRLESIRF